MLKYGPQQGFWLSPHCLTICKICSYCVPREACTLKASYLRGRKQRIKLGNTRSECTELLKGVPQGSILGPLIFNIFLNYFVSKGDLYNYADDNCISVSHKDISVLSTQLENETRVMTKWFADNSMKANVDKFQGIVLPESRNNTYVQVSFGRCRHCICTENRCSGCVYWNLISMNMSIAFVQKLVPKYLLYNAWRD